MGEILFIIFVIVMVFGFMVYAGIFIIEPSMKMDLNKCKNLSIQRGADLFEMDYEYEDKKVCILSFCESELVNNESFLGKCITEAWRFDSNGQSSQLPADKGE